MEASTVPPSGGASARRFRRSAAGGVGPLGLGVATLWLSVIVLLPLAAIVGKAFSDGTGPFFDAISTSRATSTLQVTVGVSVVVAVVNLVVGTLIAWVLVRDDFPGKRIVDAIIDLPFALPTIVASIVLLSLYGPNSPLNLDLYATQPLVVIALLFVTLPFVVRSVQPVLIELDKEVEEAAASLGASNLTTFRRIILPALLPAMLTGTGLAFTRAIGEFGSIVLISGAIPGETEVASQYIRQRIEIDRVIDAAAVSVVLLAIAFVSLFLLRWVGGRAARRQEAAR